MAPIRWSVERSTRGARCEAAEELGGDDQNHDGPERHPAGDPQSANPGVVGRGFGPDLAGCCRDDPQIEGVGMEWLGQAFELEQAAIVELPTGSGRQIAHGRTYEDLAGVAAAISRAAVCTVIPLDLPSRSSTSPACSPTRTLRSSDATPRAISPAQASASVGRAKVAKKPSPAVSSSVARSGGGRRERSNGGGRGDRPRHDPRSWPPHPSSRRCR